MRTYVIALFVLAAVFAASAASAQSLDLRSASFAYDAPVVWTHCIDSGIGCSRIVSPSVHKTVSYDTRSLNDSTDVWTATVTLSTDFSGTYTHVPLAIEVPKSAELHAGGNTPYEIVTKGQRRWILMSVPELNSTRTVRISVLEPHAQTILARVTQLLASF